MRRRTEPQVMASREPKPLNVDTNSKTFRVNVSSDKSEMVNASRMIVENDGLKFEDAKGNVVAVFRGYGLSAVADDNCCAQQGDPCETVRASNFF